MTVLQHAALVSLATAALLYGQARHEFRFAFNPAVHPVSVPAGSELTIELPAVVGASVPWIAGFQIASGYESIGISVTRAFLKSTGSWAVPFVLERFEELNPDVSGNRIIVRFDDQRSDPLMIYVKASPGHKVTIMAGQRNLFVGVIGWDTIVKDGRPYTHRVVGPASVPWALLLPLEAAAALDAPRVFEKGATVRANLSALKEHLIAGARPQLSGSTPCCASVTLPEFFEFEITISPEGKVVAVEQIGGDVALGNVVMASLRLFSFRPFEVNGRRLSVTARVPFTLTKGGNFISPLL